MDKPVETLIKEGTLVFKEINESPDGDMLKFNPELKIDYYIYQRVNQKGTRRVAIVCFDFGMENSYAMDVERNWLLQGYLNVNKEDLEDCVRVNCIFDLFHAFTHYQQDPNYSHVHWALYGNLKDRTTVIERE